MIPFVFFWARIDRILHSGQFGGRLPLSFTRWSMPHGRMLLAVTSQSMPHGRLPLANTSQSMPHGRLPLSVSKKPEYATWTLATFQLTDEDEDNIDYFYCVLFLLLFPLPHATIIQQTILKIVMYLVS